MKYIKRLQRKRKRMYHIIKDYMYVLDDRRSELIFMRYYYGWTLERVAAKMGITRQRVLQMEQDCIQKLYNEYYMMLHVR